METRVRIAAIGEITEDAYLRGESIVARELDGISLNFARAAAFEGAEAHLFAAVGNDEAAKRIISALSSTDIVPHLQEMEGASAVQRIKLSATGERIFDGFTAGVMRHFAPSAADLATLRSFDLIALPASPDTAHFFPRLLAWGKQNGIRTAADFSIDSPLLSAAGPAEWVAPFAAHLDVAFIGGDRTHEAELQRLATSTNVLIVLTLGREGAVAFRGDNEWRVDALPVQVVDTTGCGDAFQAAFATAFCGGAPIPQALQRAAQLAARVAAKRGASPA